MSDIEATFSDIFTQKRWGEGESVSGAGSSLHATAELLQQLFDLFATKGIRTMDDAPCGDFNWIGPSPAMTQLWSLMPDQTRQGLEAIAAHDRST